MVEKFHDLYRLLDGEGRSPIGVVHRNQPSKYMTNAVPGLDPGGYSILRFAFFQIVVSGKRQRKDLPIRQRQDHHHLCATAAAWFGMDSTAERFNDRPHQGEAETRVP